MATNDQLAWLHKIDEMNEINPLMFATRRCLDLNLTKLNVKTARSSMQHLVKKIIPLSINNVKRRSAVFSLQHLKTLSHCYRYFGNGLRSRVA